MPSLQIFCGIFSFFIAYIVNFECEKQCQIREQKLKSSFKSSTKSIKVTVVCSAHAPVNFFAHSLKKNRHHFLVHLRQKDSTSVDSRWVWNDDVYRLCYIHLQHVVWDMKHKKNLKIKSNVFNIWRCINVFETIKFCWKCTGSINQLFFRDFAFVLKSISEPMNSLHFNFDYSLLNFNFGTFCSEDKSRWIAYTKKNRLFLAYQVCMRICVFSPWFLLVFFLFFVVFFFISSSLVSSIIHAI